VVAGSNTIAAHPLSHRFLCFLAGQRAFSKQFIYGNFISILAPRFIPRLQLKVASVVRTSKNQRHDVIGLVFP
jgi:hypothetical protein